MVTRTEEVLKSKLLITVNNFEEQGWSLTNTLILGPTVLVTFERESWTYVPVDQIADAS